MTQLIWVLNVLLRIVICYLFNQDIWDTSKEGPKCPGPNCPGPKCPGPNCPGAQLSWIRESVTKFHTRYVHQVVPKVILRG